MQAPWIGGGATSSSGRDATRTVRRCPRSSDRSSDVISLDLTSAEALAMTGTGAAIISEGGDPRLLDGVRVSEDYFRVVGVEPFMGRSFTPEEYRRDGPEVVIVSHDVWTTRFGADPDLLGRTISIEGLAYTVVGVMPEDFVWYRNADAQTPLSLWRPNP